MMETSEMASSEMASNELSPAVAELQQQSEPAGTRLFTLKRLRGGLLFIVGYLLSPLCWWNDLIFNLPVAYGFGYLCSLVSQQWLLPGLIVGYWLSNVIGFVLMQFGAIDAIQKESKPRNPKKDLLMGVVSSTIYTLLIIGLVQFHIIDAASLLPSELFDLASFLPKFGGLQ